MNKKYVVEFTEQQLKTIVRGLAFYSRFLAGQWQIPEVMQSKEYELQGKYDGFWDKRNFVEDQLKILKSNFTGLQLNASYGIGSESLDEDAKIAYDIYRPILEEFNKDSETWNVYTHPGLQYGNEGRIKIEVKNDEKDN